MNEKIKQRIEGIKTKEDFEDYISRVKMSSAPVKQREEIMKEAERMHPKFAGVVDTHREEITQMIEDGKADISDMGNAY